jgi:hypothetical protein
LNVQKRKTKRKNVEELSHACRLSFCVNGRPGGRPQQALIADHKGVKGPQTRTWPYNSKRSLKTKTKGPVTQDGWCVLECTHSSGSKEKNLRSL